MKINNDVLKELDAVYGDSFYLLDSQQFKNNYCELKQAFSSIYPNTNIAYSYKTNYIPKLCKIVDDFGGYAEVVSDMEMEIALRIGVNPRSIIWNGPYKNLQKVRELLFLGGTVNLDSVYEIDFIQLLAEQYPDHILNVGIRCNFDIGDGVVSRFGFDTESKDFEMALTLTNKFKNIHLVGLQCHFAARSLETWSPRVEGMLKLIDQIGIKPDHIDLGGGLFGKMPDTLKEQFSSSIPSYQEYADVAASISAEHYQNDKNKPELLIEPGSALVGDCMKFVSKVINIKKIRDKNIATLLGSIYNINPTLNSKNPPLEIYHTGNLEQKYYEDIDFGGFTCIESDYLYRHFNGKLSLGDTVVFGNAGSYSIVLKPPFILPNFPILDICGEKAEVIKRQESFDDLFHTFSF